MVFVPKIDLDFHQSQWKEATDSEIILTIDVFIRQLPQEQQAQTLNLTTAHPSTFTLCPLSSTAITQNHTE